MDYQRLLLDHLDLITQIVRAVGRRRHLSATEREDFASVVHLRLVDDNYAILRKFQHRSNLSTYLAAVIERMSLKFCKDLWGRWRPSAMAERLGPVAVVLERLVARDSHTVDEALEILRTNHDVGLTYAELRKIWEQLPLRVRNAEVGEDAARQIGTNDDLDAAIDDAVKLAGINRLEKTLQRAFAQVAPQDRVLIALRFDQDLSIVEIAQLTGSSVSTLHRRLDRSVKQLRLALSRAGFEPREVVSLIGHPSLALSPLLRTEIERFLGSGALYKKDG